MTGVDNRFSDRRDENEMWLVSLAVSPDGRCFATAADSCNIALWDAQTGTHITTLDNAGDIYSLEFLPSGQLASGNDDGEISLWDTVTGSRVRTIKKHRDTIISLSALQSKLASGSKDKTVRMWDTTTWECTSFECDHAVESVSLYPNISGDRVAVCTSEIFYVWEIATQQLIRSVKVGECRGLAVSNDGKWLAVAADETISLYDASTSTLNCIGSHHRQSSSVSFSLDSSQLMSANFNNGKVELLDVQTGDLVKSFEHGRVERAVYSYDGTRGLSGESHSGEPSGPSQFSYIYQFPMVLVDSGISI